MKIVTSYSPLGWHAWDDDTYDGPEDKRVGWGNTEEEAIEDLKMIYEEQAEQFNGHAG